MDKINNNNKIRLNKAIALSGLCSRRKADELIKNGKVKINGKNVTELSFYVSSEDKITVNEKLITFLQHKYVLLNKPAGYITSTQDEHGRKIVFDLLPLEYKHLKIAGRLDRESEGLVVLSNDGVFLNLIQSPQNNVKKFYLATIQDFISDQEVEIIRKNMLNGVKLDNFLCKVDSIKKVHNNISDKKQTTFEIVIHEGKNRQLRRMFQKQGLSVIKLKRFKIGSFELEGIKPRQHKEISRKEAYANLHI